MSSSSFVTKKQLANRRQVLSCTLHVTRHLVDVILLKRKQKFEKIMWQSLLSDFFIFFFFISFSYLKLNLKFILIIFNFTIENFSF